MKKENRETADSRDLRCLMICNSVLERVNGVCTFSCRKISAQINYSRLMTIQRYKVS